MMNVDSWCAILADGRSVRYEYKELSDGIAAISATIDGWSVMILQRSVRAPLTRAQVEAVFAESYGATGPLLELRSHGSRASFAV
jgi:hypothetical protein